MSALRLEELRGHVDKLTKLLDDPHPGLSVWVGFYGERMQALSNFWNLVEGASHVGQRMPNRSKCEKCGAKTNWTVTVMGRRAYWCGCD